jgi:hypothetical protein
LTIEQVLAGEIALPSNRDLIEMVVAHRETRFLALVLRPGIDLSRNMIPPLVEVLEGLVEGGALDLYLDTLGSASPEAWRLVSILRERFDRYTGLIPFAASAGATQVALGADDLLMGEASSLSPIEPPHRRGGENGGRRGQGSSYDVRHFLAFLKREFGVERVEDLGAPDAALWSSVDPLEIGAAERAFQNDRIATRRCLETHIDSETQRGHVSRILGDLASGVLSRDFPVTRLDCERRLGLDVLKPGQELGRALWKLRAYYQKVLDLEGQVQVQDGQHYVMNFDGFIDSLDERRLLVRVTRTDADGAALEGKVPIFRWVRPNGQDVVVGRDIEY